MLIRLLRNVGRPRFGSPVFPLKSVNCWMDNERSYGNCYMVTRRAPNKFQHKVVPNLRLFPEGACPASGTTANWLPGMRSATIFIIAGGDISQRCQSASGAVFSWLLIEQKSWGFGHFVPAPE
ncbi:MAG: hypothetical protein Ct9H300mP11_31130 [Chloroflexota bacterium]|nr:MAG: hypothetical protein Ct9H300mP11_31130 [Chloroflexota bacterium]